MSAASNKTLGTDRATDYDLGKLALGIEKLVNDPRPIPVKVAALLEAAAKYDADAALEEFALYFEIFKDGDWEFPADRQDALYPPIDTLNPLIRAAAKGA